MFKVMLKHRASLWEYDCLSQLPVERQKNRNEAGSERRVLMNESSQLQLESLNKIYLHVSNLVSSIQSAAVCNGLSLLYLAQPVFGG